MKEHLRNALFGLVDYVAYPAAMFALAPLILRELGMERFGVWALANAAWNIGSVLASGFGDANIRAVADARARGAQDQVLASVRSTLTIHIVMGTLIAALVLAAAPWMAGRTTASMPEIHADCLWSLRIAAPLIWLRAVETVCVSTQRAFARYGPAIQVSIIARLLSIAAAWFVPMIVASVRIVMLSTLAVSGVALLIQARQLQKLLALRKITPLFGASQMRTLVSFGIFTWIQSATGLLLGQIDRLIAGVSFGAAAVTSYTLCVQLAQPTYGLCASGFHFLFPYLAYRSALRLSLRGSIVKASIANLLFSGGMLAILLTLGHSVLRAWVGARVADAASSLLAPVAWSSALSGMAVTAGYALLALNKPRTVTTFNLLGTVAMLTAADFLIPRYGMEGLAYARLMFGPAVLLAYIPVFMNAKRHTPNQLERGKLGCAEI